ncbi:MAG: TRAM domain-containing protein [Bifidobacterium psychraerophilum]|uniref:class I SAM-dependent RNA methyltransferase n=1 Tax=Bifidobacterium psychraerophilum TaxID=218140 RepID=UPI0039EAF2E5
MQVEIRIERFADQGRCVGHVDGRVVFVRFALPGELLRVTIDEPHERDDRFWTAEVDEVLEASPDRVAYAWPLAGPLSQGGGLGGADLCHVSLDGQLRWKADIIQEQMRRLGHQDIEVPITRPEGDAALGGLHWRTRIEMIADEEGRPSMRRRGTHQRVQLRDMPLATKSLLTVAEQQGFWDTAYTPGTHIRLSVPEPRGAKGPGDNFGLLSNDELQAGTQKLQEKVEINGRSFNYRVDASGFWQVHRDAPQALAGEVVNLLRARLGDARRACIWDLYSGSGLFTLPLATMISERCTMLSVEGSKTAVRNARHNLRSMDVNHVDARCGDVAATIAHLPSNLDSPDAIVLDPPRAGARGKVCRQIAQSKASTVVYVACDPTSLARDVGVLCDLGYSLDSVQAFDIYPMTHHVETVALLSL